MSQPFLLIYTTYKNKEASDAIVNPLLQENLIACANFFPITSRYHWKGAIENTEEIVVILKTRKENWEKVRDFIEKRHPYETPCIIKLAEVESNESYASWIEEATGK